MKKSTGEVPYKDPTFTVLVGEKSWNAALHVPALMKKKDVAALFLTCFEFIKEHNIRLSRDEQDELGEFFCNI
jgi:hypothetical protein